MSRHDKLEEYLERYPAVVMAFLFGSRLSGRERGASDWDIGVYLTQEDRDAEHRLWRGLERQLGSEVDMVVLNRAPATVAWRIMGQGEPLVIKDRRRYLEQLLRVSDEADAYYRTAEEYYQVFERSASLAAGDRQRLQRIVTWLEEEVKDYPNFAQLTFAEYARNRSLKREVEHWIEHLVNAAVDVAKIILAGERRPLPETYAEMLITLDTVELFAADALGSKLSAWVRLRDILAHEYLDLRWKNISEFIAETEPLWQELICRVKKLLS